MHTYRAAASLLAAVFAMGAVAFAQVESTPIPASAKTDFSKMAFLTGTWTCSIMSSRRPGPYTTTNVASMSSDGHWLITKTTVHKASWIPASFTGEDRMTWDSSTSRWVDIATDDTGGYDVTSSPGWNGNTIVWTDQFYPKSNNTATNNPTTMTKVSGTKTVSTSSFTEPGGRLVHVKTTCTKG